MVIISPSQHAALYFRVRLNKYCCNSLHFELILSVLCINTAAINAVLFPCSIANNAISSPSPVVVIVSAESPEMNLAVPIDASQKLWRCAATGYPARNGFRISWVRRRFYSYFLSLFFFLALSATAFRYDLNHFNPTLHLTATSLPWTPLY